ncbi:MAG: NADH-quinone oxidoreductase subunit J family protein [Anaerolineae bacterium]
MQQIVFIILSLITLGAAVGVVTTKSLFRSALWLILSFFGIAGLFILLHAEFLAVVQVLIYIGAISTLIIFAIMLSRGMMDPKQPRFNDQWRATLALVLVLAAVLGALVTRVAWPVAKGEVPTDAIQRLGVDFVGPYVIPFEVASVLLVAAMIGAIIIARERE